MTYDVLIRGGGVVLDAGVVPRHIGIAEGRVVAIAQELPGTATETIDATGLHVFPGVIDCHVHFNDPGRTAWEGVATGSAALAAGGGTCFFDMPLNASPPTLDGPSFDAKLAACKPAARTDFALWGGLTPQNVDRLDELALRGVIGFKAFMSNSGMEDFLAVDDISLYRGMQIAAQLGLPVAVHAENETMTSRLAADARKNGRRGIRDYLQSRPVIAETEAISRAIHFAQDTGCALHIVHVSTARGIDLVRRAAADGVNVTCETCPHYLLLCEDDLERLGAAAKCAPPIRPAAGRDALCQRVAAGSVDIISSDHSPAPATMKQSADFFEVWGGIAGVQTTLQSMLSLQPAIALPQIAAMLSANVARRFALAHKGGIQIGQDADLALINLAATFTLAQKDLLDRHKLSPYVGRAFAGRVQRTLLRGQTIALDGAIAAPPRGRLCRPLERTAELSP